jgi:hypothetical protein
VSNRTGEDRCSLRSLAGGESLAATASSIRRWLLVEHPGPWGRDGLLDARLPDRVGSDLLDLARRTAARVLLIRKPGGRPMTDGIRCFAIDTREAWIGSRVVERYEDLAELDPRDRDRFHVHADPLFVTCTHGRRDVCCAEQGRPLADALDRAIPELAWESTHVGGDRFAANLVAFPHGLFFGRVEPPEGVEVARAYLQGRIAPLRRYRGRASDRRDVQVADRTLRDEFGLDGIEALRLLRRSRTGDRAEVTFATPRGEVTVRLERAVGSPMRLTCHATRAEALVSWRPVGIERAGTMRRG